MPIDPQWDDDGEVFMIKVCRKDNAVILSEEEESGPRDSKVLHPSNDEATIRYVLRRVRTWLIERWLAHNRIN